MALRASSGLMPTRLSGRVTESGPEEMVTRTVAPFSACVPAVGSVEATDPSATVSEATLSGLSSQVNPACSIWVFASACVRPTTLGTAIVSACAAPRVRAHTEPPMSSRAMTTRVAMIAVRRLRDFAASSSASAVATGGSDVEVAAIAGAGARLATAAIGMVAAVWALAALAAGSTSVAHESAGGAPTSRPRATRCRSASIAAALG